MALNLWHKIVLQHSLVPLRADIFGVAVLIYEKIRPNDASDPLTDFMWIFRATDAVVLLVSIAAEVEINFSNHLQCMVTKQQLLLQLDQALW